MIHDKITFHCIKNVKSDIQRAWPRKDSNTTKALDKWLGNDYFHITVDNHFTDVYIDQINYRNDTAVPSAVIPLYDKGISVKIDFRVEGIIDLVRYGSVVDGIVKSPMCIVFRGSTYRLIPSTGDIIEDHKAIDKLNKRK